MKKLLLLVLSIILLTACGSQANESSPGMGMGNNNMMNRHHAQIPAEYAGLKNPITADEASLERGAQLYGTNCASCHGDGGMGDGPAGSALDPVPAPVAHTSQMMADDYLFWRISEGGTPFNTSMPPWKSLDEQSRWDLINYVRALGAGTVQPGAGMGGVAFDPTQQAVQQAEMLAKAVDQKVITQGRQISSSRSTMQCNSTASNTPNWLTAGIMPQSGKQPSCPRWWRRTSSRRNRQTHSQISMTVWAMQG